MKIKAKSRFGLWAIWNSIKNDPHHDFRKFTGFEHSKTFGQLSINKLSKTIMRPIVQGFCQLQFEDWTCSTNKPHSPDTLQPPSIHVRVRALELILFIYEIYHLWCGPQKRFQLQLIMWFSWKLFSNVSPGTTLHHAFRSISIVAIVHFVLIWIKGIYEQWCTKASFGPSLGNIV